MAFSWLSRWLKKRSSKAAKGSASGDRPARPRALPLNLELLEDRTLLSVTPSLTGGILDIQLDAPNDNATLSLVTINNNPNIRVSDGTTAANFPVAAVQSINAHGTNLGNQNVTLNDTLTLSGILQTSAVANVTIHGTYTAGSANLAAGVSVDVHAGATLSSRHTANADPLGTSIAGSGNLTLAAPVITVGNGARLLAGADNGFAAGDVTLQANGAAAVDTILGIPNTQNVTDIATVNIGAAKITGHDVTVAAKADTANAAGLPLPPPNQLVQIFLDILQANLPIDSSAAASLATANATVIVGNLAYIQASGDVKLDAQALSATTLTSSAQDVTVAFGSSAPSAGVYVNGSIFGAATITAGGNFDASAKTVNSLDVTALVPDPNNAANVSIAYGRARSNAVVDIQHLASIAAANASVRAENTNDLRTRSVAAGFGVSGSAGVGASVAIGDYQSNAQANVAGFVVTSGDLSIDAKSVNTHNTQAFGAVLAPSATSALMPQVASYLAGLPLSANVGGKLLNVADPNASVAVGGAVAIAVVDNSASASTSNASLGVGGNLDLSSEAKDNPRISATASAGDATQVSVGGAVAVSSLTNQAIATIGDGTTVDVAHTLHVHADAEVPSPLAFDPLLDLQDIDTATGTARIGEEFADGAAAGTQAASALAPLAATLAPLLADPNGAATSFVHAGGTVLPGGTASVAGGVNVENVTNVADASIGSFSGVNQFVSSPDQDVKVDASASVGTVDLAGQPSALNFTGGAAGGAAAVGGFFDLVHTDNTAKAHIDAATVLAGRDIDVASDTSHSSLMAVQAGSAGDSVGVDGAITIAPLNNFSLAFIDDGAFVDANHDVNITAQNSGVDVNVTGGQATGPVVGIGVSAAFTSVDNVTAAFVGLNDPNQSSPSVTAGHDVNVHAQTDQKVLTVSVAGADAPGINHGMGGEDVFEGREFGFGISGDVAFNDVTNTTTASLRDGAAVSAGHAVALQADDLTHLAASAGAAASGNALGIGGSFAANQLTKNTQASTEYAGLLTPTLTALANSVDHLLTVSDGSGQAKTTAAVAGSVDLNNVHNTTEAALGSGTIANVGDVLLQANGTVISVSDAGASSASPGSAAVGAAIDLGFINNTVRADVGSGANITASGDVRVFAASAEDIDSVSASLAQANQDGVGAAGSLSLVNVTPVTQAFVGAGATLTTPNTVLLNAVDNTKLGVLAGAAAGGDLAGVGLSASRANVNRTVQAYVGNGATVSAQGNGNGLLTPELDGFGGTGLFLRAASQDDILSYSAGTASDGDVTVQASAIINSIGGSTEAFIDQGASVNQNNAGASPTQAVGLLAEHKTDLLGVAGSYAGAQILGIGAAGDIEMLGSTVRAAIESGANVNSATDVVLQGDPHAGEQLLPLGDDALL